MHTIKSMIIDGFLFPWHITSTIIVIPITVIAIKIKASKFFAKLYISTHLKFCERCRKIYRYLQFQFAISSCRWERKKKSPAYSKKEINELVWSQCKENISRLKPDIRILFSNVTPRLQIRLHWSAVHVPLSLPRSRLHNLSVNNN